MSEDIEKPDQAKGDKEVLEKLMNGDGDNEEKVCNTCKIQSQLLYPITHDQHCQHFNFF